MKDSGKKCSDEFNDLLLAAKTALSVAESYIKNDYEGTKYYQAMMADLDSVREAISKAEG